MLKTSKLTNLHPLVKMPLVKVFGLETMRFTMDIDERVEEHASARLSRILIHVRYPGSQSINP